jgi:hypothetical protein
MLIDLRAPDERTPIQTSQTNHDGSDNFVFSTPITPNTRGHTMLIGRCKKKFAHRAGFVISASPKTDNLVFFQQEFQENDE